MIISLYLANLFDSWQTITNKKLFLCVFTFSEGNILSSKNYNISIELLNRNTSFEKNELNFGITGKKFLFFVYDNNLRRIFTFRWNILRGELIHGLGGKAFVSNIAFVHAPCKNRSNPINVITIWNVIIQFSRLSGKVHLGDKKRSRLWP